MPDDIDLMMDRDAPLIDASVEEIRAAAARIPRGYAGYCDMCGEYMPRLINGACCRCRDMYKLG